MYYVVIACHKVKGFEEAPDRNFTTPFLVTKDIVFAVKAAREAEEYNFRFGEDGTCVLIYQFGLDSPCQRNSISPAFARSFYRYRDDDGSWHENYNDDDFKRLFEKRCRQAERAALKKLTARNAPRIRPRRRK